MKRHYYISDDLDDLEHVEEELEKAGMATPQIHVLSRDDAGVARHAHLHPVEAVLKTDVVRGMRLGAMIGAVGMLGAFLALGGVIVTSVGIIAVAWRHMR